MTYSDSASGNEQDRLDHGTQHLERPRATREAVILGRSREDLAHPAAHIVIDLTRPVLAATVVRSPLDGVVSGGPLATEIEMGGSVYLD